MPLGFPQNVKAKSLVVSGTTVLSGAVSMTATSSGFLLPRLSATEISSLVDTPDGMLVYDTTNDVYVGWANGAQVTITHS